MRRYLTAKRLYDQHPLVTSDYAESDEWPMKVTAYDPPNQVVRIAYPCNYPRYDGGWSTHGRELRLDQALIDPYDAEHNNGSNRTQLVSNDITNTFAAFLPGERKATAFVIECGEYDLPRMLSGGGDYSQVMQWKSIRANGSGSDPFLTICEANDGLVLIYNSVQYWRSVGGGFGGYKQSWPIAGNFKDRQIKLVLDATFADGLGGGFRLSGELTSDEHSPLVELVPWQRFPTLSPGSPGATVSWGPYQETWLPSVTRRYWDIEVLA